MRREAVHLVLVGDLGLTTDTASTGGSNETHLATGGGSTAHSGRVTNMLMVTATMTMFDRVPGNTTNTGPHAVLLTLVLEIGVTGLEERLLETATTSNDANHGTAVGVDALLEAGRELQAGTASVDVVANDDGAVATSTGNTSTVANLGLNVADNGGLGELANGENVANGKGSLAAHEHVLASESTLGGDHKLSNTLVSSGVAELDGHHGSTTAGVVEDLPDDTTHVTVAVRVVHHTQLGGSKALVASNAEDGPLSLTTRQ